MQQQISAAQLKRLLDNRDQLTITLKNLENKVTYDLIPILTEILKTKEYFTRLISKLIVLQPKLFNSQTLQIAIQKSLSAPLQITLLKAIGALLQEFKIDTPDHFIRVVFRCCFTGIPYFGNLQPEHLLTDLSSDSEGQSDAAQKANAKMRAVGVLLLKVLIKEFPLYFQNNWQLFLQKLLQLLQHETRKNIKINLVQLIIVLLDTLNISKWLQGVEIIKLQGFQPKAYIIYQGVKQVHETVLALLQSWRQQDSAFIIQLLKLEIYLLQQCKVEDIAPLYQMMLQILSDPNIKSGAMQLASLLINEGAKGIDSKFLINLAYQGLKDENENYQAECFSLLQQCQQHYHKEFCELISYESLNRVKKNTQYYKIYEEISRLNCDSIYDQFQIDIILECLHSTQQNQSELLSVGFNIISNLLESFWSQQQQNKLTQLISQLKALYLMIYSETPLNMSSLKISFYKAIGTLCSCQTIVNQFARDLSKMFNNAQGNNIHVLEKSSWAAANLSSQTILDKEFYEIFLAYALNSKEKISTNGLRGLGFYLMRSQKIETKDLINCYSKALINKNPKISWNASTSILNAIQNQGWLLTDIKIKQSVLQVLKQNDNLKAQLHCVELVQYFNDDYSIEFLQALIFILVNFKNHDNFIEKKNQSKMREKVIQLLESFFQKIPFKQLISCLDDILHQTDSLDRVVSEIYAYLLEKKPQDSEIIFANGDLTKDEVLSLKLIDDETTFRQQNEHQYVIIQYLKVPFNEDFNQIFKKLAFISTTLYSIIDESESDKIIGFQALEALRELGSDSTLIKIYKND